MSGTLDQFFGTTPLPPEERCSNPQCRKKLHSKDIKFKLRVEGELKPYCMACYKAKLKLLENNEESL